MARNHIQVGHAVQVTASGTSYVSGTPIQLGDLIGVPLVDIADGETGSVQITEAWTLPKLSTDDISAWQTVNFDRVNSRITDQTVGAGNGIAGAAVAIEAAGAGTTTVKVLLLPGAGSAT